MITIADLLAELEQEAHATRRVLARVPDAHLDWRPHERSFTLGQLAMHVATLPGAIADVAAHGSFDVSLPIPRPGASGADELVATLDASVAHARTVIAAMDDATLATPWHAVDGERVVLTVPLAALFRTTLLNHWYHHRGQLTVYLRQTGARVPALYGPSADEVPGGDGR